MNLVDGSRRRGGSDLVPKPVCRELPADDLAHAILADAAEQLVAVAGVDASRLDLDDPADAIDALATVGARTPERSDDVRRPALFEAEEGVGPAKVGRVV